jgi:hypothetical protein
VPQGATERALSEQRALQKASKLILLLLIALHCNNRKLLRAKDLTQVALHSRIRGSRIGMIREDYTYSVATVNVMYK